MNLSKNFTVNEMIRSSTAARKGISNNPGPTEIKNLISLCDNVLQPLREDLNMSIRVNSGYRSKKLNKKIGGSKTSSHVKGQAADIECALSTYELAKYIKDNYEFDQLILEFYNPKDHNSGWVHVSYSTNNRNEVLSAVKEKVNGKMKTVYKRGLVE